MYFSNKYALFDFLNAVFAEKKPPEGAPPASTRGLEASNHLVWSHPITLRSLVVWSTDVGPKISQSFDMFLNFFGIIWDVSGGSLEVLRSNFGRKYFRDFY